MMKRNDLALIGITVLFSAIFAIVITNAVFTPKKTKQLTAQKVDPIKADFQNPDSRYFNNQAINPTKLIQIGDSSNPRPF